MKEQLQHIKAEDNHIILVCDDDGEIIGSVMGVICRELYGDCRPFLVVENMIVDKELRNGFLILEVKPELNGFFEFWRKRKPLLDILEKNNIEFLSGATIAKSELIFILLQNIQCIWVCKSSNKTISLPVMFS